MSLVDELYQMLIDRRKSVIEAINIDTNNEQFDVAWNICAGAELDSIDKMIAKIDEAQQ